MDERPSALRLHEADNVAVALCDLEAGAVVELGDHRVVLTEPIAFGHKLAAESIAEGAAVRKYDEVIGVATAAIATGRHVHVHNVVSGRLPGPEGPPA